MRYLGLAGLVFLSVVLAACGRYEANERVYEKSHGVPEVVTPPGAVPPAQEAFYYVNQGKQFPKSDISIIPPGSKVNDYCNKKPKEVKKKQEKKSA